MYPEHQEANEAGEKQRDRRIAVKDGVREVQLLCSVQAGIVDHGDLGEI